MKRLIKKIVKKIDKYIIKTAGSLLGFLKNSVIQHLLNSDKSFNDNITTPIEGVDLIDTSPGAGDARQVQPARGYKFDGVDDKVVFLTGEKLGTICFSCYFSYTGTLTSKMRLLGSEDSDLDEMRTVGSFEWAYYPSGGGFFIRMLETDFNDGFPHYLMFKVVQKAGNVDWEIYLDGELKNSGTEIGHILSHSDEKLKIGEWNNNSFSGNIWDWRVWATEKTYEETLNGDLSGIIVWAKCDEKEGNICYNSDGTGRHGVIENATLSNFHTTFDNGNGSDFQNQVGYTDSGSALIPRDESNPGFDVLGASLQFKGRVPYNAYLFDAPAGNFDATDDYILIPHSSNLNVNQEITLVAKCILRGFRDPTTLILKEGEYSLKILTDGTVEFEIFAAGVPYTLNGLSLLTNTYVVIFAIYKDGVMSLRQYEIGYEDSAAGSSISVIIDSGINPLYIGGEPGGGNTADERVFDIQIWGVGWTEQQMIDYKENYLINTLELSLSDQLGWWPISENSGTTIFDRSGNGNNGTLINGVENDFWSSTNNFFFYDFLYNGSPLNADVVKIDRNPFGAVELIQAGVPKGDLIAYGDDFELTQAEDYKRVSDGIEDNFIVLDSEASEKNKEKLAKLGFLP